jgi:hypothetical protein
MIHDAQQGRTKEEKLERLMDAVYAKHTLATPPGLTPTGSNTGSKAPKNSHSSGTRGRVGGQRATRQVTSPRTLHVHLDHKVYEVMSGVVGEVPEKTDEFREAKGYWDRVLCVNGDREKIRTYDYVRYYTGYTGTWVEVKWVGTRFMRVSEKQFTAGPYSNGYRKTFGVNEMWVVMTAEVTREHHPAQAGLNTDDTDDGIDAGIDVAALAKGLVPAIVKAVKAEVKTEANSRAREIKSHIEDSLEVGSARIIASINSHQDKAAAAAASQGGPRRQHQREEEQDENAEGQGGKKEFFSQLRKNRRAYKRRRSSQPPESGEGAGEYGRRLGEWPRGGWRGGDLSPGDNEDEWAHEGAPSSGQHGDWSRTRPPPSAYWNGAQFASRSNHPPPPHYYEQELSRQRVAAIRRRRQEDRHFEDMEREVERATAMSWQAVGYAHHGRPYMSGPPPY